MEPRAPSQYWLTRAVFLRLLGAVYVAAFASLAWQVVPLVGHRGLLPAAQFLDEVAAWARAHGASPTWTLPTLFWLSASDRVLALCADGGLVLALAVALGRANAPMLAALWALYLSFVDVGQLFYGYGWETLLCETGFLAIFLAPSWRARALPEASAPSTVVVYLLRWLLFRVVLGAGLIKLRGDACWRELTCLDFHFETQPEPGPLSWLFASAPHWVHATGVVFNHVAELVAPLFLFGPRRVAIVAGLVEAAFQVTLILSGNLSWLNWLTLALCVACFDDAFLARVLPRRLAATAAERARTISPSLRARTVAWILAVAVAALSVPVVVNLVSREQEMNASFDPLRLVNTYGAFGSVGRARDELVIEGTADAVPDERATWRAYEFPCKPGDPSRRPPQCAPFQWRLDWQLWFAAMSDIDDEPWLSHLVDELLRGEPAVKRLLAVDPFPVAPPRFVRITRWHYRFARRGEPGWWVREGPEPYLAPVGRDDPMLRALVRQYGWPE